MEGWSLSAQPVSETGKESQVRIQTGEGRGGYGDLQFWGVESREICFTWRELDLRKLSGPIITANI